MLFFPPTLRMFLEFQSGVYILQFHGKSHHGHLWGTQRGTKRNGKSREMMSLKHFPVYTCVHTHVCWSTRWWCVMRENTKVTIIRSDAVMVKYKVIIILKKNQFGNVLYSVLSKNMDCGARLLRFKSQSCLHTSSVIFSKVFSFLCLSLLICQIWVIKIPI